MARVWLRGWSRPVSEAISRENPLYRLQKNKYTRGISAKPVVALTDVNPYLASRWKDYVCQTEPLPTGAWANNGYEIATSLAIANGVRSLLAAFGDRPQLSVIELQRLPENDRIARRDAFLGTLSDEYNQDAAAALDPSFPDRRMNTSSCPVNAGLAMITLVNDRPEAGALTGGGQRNIGDTIAVTALPSDGFAFVGWREEGEIVSADSSYSFAVTGDRTLAGVFEALAIPVYTVSLSSENESGGTVEGGGQAAQGNSVPVKAVPKAGYAFVGWYYNGQTLAENLGAEGAFYPWESCALIARFTESYEVVVVSEDQEEGTAYGGGQVLAGNHTAIIAVPKAGYAFDGWYYNGQTALPDLAAADEFAPYEACALVARFKPTITVSAAAATADGSMVSFSAYGPWQAYISKAAEIGETVELYVRPALGYEVVAWKNGYGANIGEGTKCVIQASEDENENKAFVHTKRRTLFTIKSKAADGGSYTLSQASYILDSEAKRFLISDQGLELRADTELSDGAVFTLGATVYVANLGAPGIPSQAIPAAEVTANGEFELTV